MIISEIGIRLKEYANKFYNGNISSFARASNTAQPQIHRYIDSKAEPSCEVLVRFFNLGINLNWLLTGEELPKSTIINNSSNDTFTQTNNDTSMGNQTKADKIYNHLNPGISETAFERQLERRESDIAWLKKQIENDKLELSMMRESLESKQRMLERFEQKSADNLTKLFDKLEEMHASIEMCYNATRNNENIIKEHKEKTIKDLDVIKRQHIKKKKKRIVSK